MRFFNAFQLVILFAALPFIVQWLRTAEFWGAQAFLWVGIVAYVVMFIFSIFAYADKVKDF